MLVIKELVIKSSQQNLVLVDRLSLSIKENDKYAIIGTEGSGKTTLLKVIKGEYPNHITVSGSIIRPSIISYLDQNVDQNWGTYTVESYFKTNLKHPLYEYYENIYKLCNQFGFNYQSIEKRQLSTFSGGEKVKIGLIKALMMSPDLLLLDEPSNDLDFETLSFLESFLKETTIPVIFVSHDQRLLENVTTGIIHIQHTNKKTKANTFFMRLNYKEYKEKYQIKFESDLMIAKKQRSDYQKKLEKFRQIYQKVEHSQNQAVRDPVLGRLLKKKIKNLKSQEKRYVKEKEQFIEMPEKEEPMNLFFDNQTSMHKKKEVLDIHIKNFPLKNNQIITAIDLSIKGNDKIAIIGKNGIGKTTFIKHLVKEALERKFKVGYLSQDYKDILDESKDVVSYLMDSQDKYTEPKIRQILGSLGLKKEEMLYNIKQLSEGTKLKVILLKLVSQNLDILILDEPTRNISPLNQDELYELFLSFNGAVIAVTHDRSFIEAGFDDVYELTLEGLFKRTV